MYKISFTLLTYIFYELVTEVSAEVGSVNDILYLQTKTNFTVSFV
jgi:hypothetical protein